MARGQKTSPEQVYAVLASYSTTNSYSQTSRDTGVSIATVKKYVDENADNPEFKKLQKEKRHDFAERANRIILKGLERIERELDDTESKIAINQLSTMIGTLYDKQALEQGKSTQNLSVEIKLPEGIEEYAE